MIRLSKKNHTKIGVEIRRSGRENSPSQQVMLMLNNMNII